MAQTLSLVKVVRFGIGLSGGDISVLGVEVELTPTLPRGDALGSMTIPRAMSLAASGVVVIFSFPVLKFSVGDLLVKYLYGILRRGCSDWNSEQTPEASFQAESWK